MNPFRFVALVMSFSMTGTLFAQDSAINYPARTIRIRA